MKLNKIIITILIFCSTLFSQNNKTSIGVNVSSINDWSTQPIFVDLMKSARPWSPQLVDDYIWNTGDTLDLDSNGWVKKLKPNQAAGTIMIIGQREKYPSGEYICLYEGEGRIEFSLDAKVVSETDGRIVLDVAPTNAGIVMKLVSTNPENYIRNIRVILPGCEETYITNPYFQPVMEMLKNFSTLRFMWWNQAIDAPIYEWEDRTPKTYYTYQDPRGVPYEVIIDLVNYLKVDPWFCIPPYVSDDFVTELATLIKNKLDPNLKAYIEYSNEVWNGIYASAWYAREQGMKLGLASDIGNNEFTAQMRFHSQRSVEIFKKFENIFGGTERLVRVLGGWTQVEYAASTIIEWQDAWQYADAYAIAPYFGHYLGASENKEWVRNMSVVDIIDSAKVDMIRVMNENLSIKNIVEARGLDLICYEAGQHLVGQNYQTDHTIDSLFQAANRHPMMYDLYSEYYQLWDELFGNLMVTYASCESWSQYGSWGLKEYWNQETSESPKWNATIDFINKLSTNIKVEEKVGHLFRLYNNYPNPFNPTTKISYQLPEKNFVTLKVYDILGREIAELINGSREAGNHVVTFDASNLSSGIYYYQIKAGSLVQSQKMLLVK